MIKKGIFYGVVKDGKVNLDNKSIFDLYIKNFEGQRIELVIEKENENWSLAQFRYLFACVYAPLAEELGYSTEEIDGCCKRKFLTRNKGTKREFVKEKSKLTKKELAEYIDCVIRLCAEMGIVVLPPDKFKAGT